MRRKNGNVLNLIRLSKTLDVLIRFLGGQRIDLKLRGDHPTNILKLQNRLLLDCFCKISSSFSDTNKEVVMSSVEKRQSFVRYWGVRILAAAIAVSGVYVAAMRFDLSSLVLIPMAVAFGIYGFLGRDLLDNMAYCPR
jgi:hypothetical protein